MFAYKYLIESVLEKYKLLHTKKLYCCKICQRQFNQIDFFEAHEKRCTNTTVLYNSPSFINSEDFIPSFIDFRAGNVSQPYHVTSVSRWLFQCARPPL